MDKIKVAQSACTGFYCKITSYEGLRDLVLCIKPEYRKEHIEKFAEDPDIAPETINKLRGEFCKD
jgi:hypothetical protein